MLDTLNGPDGTSQYVNLSFLDKGGMGAVYLADDKINQKKVAIKIIDIPDPSTEKLLRSEIEVSPQLIGENLVTTLYAGHEKLGESRFFYLVQDYYARGNLRKRITQNIDLNVCLKMFNDLLNGLSIIHKKIIHRDLKPENILVSDDDSLLIADFGLARCVEESTRTKTFKGAGTYPYMAPECWTYQHNTISMDIYSLGVIFFEVLAGQLPAECANENEWREFHLFTPLPDISQFRSDVPVKLQQTIMKMTQKRASDRFNNVDEIKASLSQAAEQAKAQQIEIERLAQMAHATIQQVTNEQIRKKERAEKEEQFQKMLNFHITELFSKTKQTVAQINERLENHPINVKESGQTPVTRKLQLQFTGKSLIFEFYPSTIFANYEQIRDARHEHTHWSTNGIVFATPSVSKFKELKMVMLGRAECSHHNASLNGRFGFNLVLCKDEQQQYGTWHVAMFDDTGWGRGTLRLSYGLRSDEFLQDFPKCFMVHTRKVDYHPLHDNDLIRAVEEILAN